MITVEQFGRLAVIELEKFKDYWVKSQKRSADMFPKMLDEDEWWEQLRVFEEMNENSTSSIPG